MSSTQETHGVERPRCCLSRGAVCLGMRRCHAAVDTTFVMMARGRHHDKGSRLMPMMTRCDLRGEVYASVVAQMAHVGCEVLKCTGAFNT